MVYLDPSVEEASFSNVYVELPPPKKPSLIVSTDRRREGTLRELM